MPMTAAENELITRVGPGTPAGELLRRYWHPVALAQEVTDENPTIDPQRHRALRRRRQ